MAGVIRKGGSHLNAESTHRAPQRIMRWRQYSKNWTVEPQQHLLILSLFRRALQGRVRMRRLTALRRIHSDGKGADGVCVKETAGKVAAVAVLGFVSYFTLSAVVLFSAMFLLRSNIAMDFPWLLSTQRFLYFKGFRNVWQGQPDCVTFDEALIYRPADGQCRFKNVEFDTTIEFSNGIRKHDFIEDAQNGIAVIGDSHAMGWGVDDTETFSSVLQGKLHRPVFNLGVSSYGTVRELEALRRSGVLDQVDTVIIQYSDNDLDENLRFRIEAKGVVAQKFARIKAASAMDTSILILSGYYHALVVPFLGIRDYVRGSVEAVDFKPHYQPLREVLERYEFLRGKKVIVFYSNGHGVEFSNFPEGRDALLPKLVFADLHIRKQSYFVLDDHLTALGHQEVADKLESVLKGLTDQFTK